MSEASVRSWKKIGLFFALTMLFSGLFDAFILHAGRMDAGNLLYITGGMWSPALATFATKAVFRESIGNLAWRWPTRGYAWLGYFIPLAYALPVYLVVWCTGLGGFGSADFVRQ